MMAVLLGALLHASWNALVRGASDRTLDTALVVGGAGLTAACWLPFAPLPLPQSWPYLAASVVTHLAYFVLVALAYRRGQLSFVYPIMRGSAPAIAAAVAALLLNELPSAGGWFGLILICCGIIVLAADSFRARSFQGSSAVFALLNSAVIVFYTLVDGVGARLSGHPVSYTGWIFLLTAFSLVAISVKRNRVTASRYFRSYWVRGLLGGACMFGSYGLALWAMTLAPIALIAALRETSVVFAAVIAAAFLGERLTPLRCLSIFIVAAGAFAIKIA
jgi:drug/metabolite transporter (DMT)-like permease